MPKKQGPKMPTKAKMPMQIKDMTKMMDGKTPMQPARKRKK